MKRLLTVAASVLVCLVVGSAERTAAQTPQDEPAGAQGQKPPQPPPEFQKIALRVQVVFSRYQGDSRISSMPYALAVNASPASYGEMSRLRMGARVPVSSFQPATADAQVNTPGGPVTISPIGPVTYQEIGTNIDCRARALRDGSFELSIELEDKSVYANDDPTTKPLGRAPVFRTFQSSNTLILRDGQSQQFTAATDRINGEVVRVEVTLTVVK